MTTADKITDIFHDLRKAIEEFEEKGLKAIDKLQNQITDPSKKPKPTRYYPNGAYMDGKDVGTYWFIYLNMYVHGSGYTGAKDDIERLDSQNCFPTRKEAEKELNRQKLTAKMYRDMRDERINGDWVADWMNYDEIKHFPSRTTNNVDVVTSTTAVVLPHNFYYKNETFTDDLKALGWSEEELKIVWFRV